MVETKQIRVNQKTAEALDKLGNRSDTYDSIIRRLLFVYNNSLK